VSELPAGGGARGTTGPAEVLALRYELGRLRSLGLLQALILSLRIADGFCQHLAQLSLGLRGFRHYMVLGTLGLTGAGP